MDNFDKFLRNENMWFKAAVGTAVLVFATVIIGTLVSLAASANAEHRGQLIDVVYKLGLIGAGLITFCTIAWRGLIATQQAEMQRLQIDKLAQQIAATEENNLATLLQKGAELIDEQKPGHVSAGLATLHAIVTATNPKFAVEAMNLVADYIQNNHSSSHDGVHFESATAVLAAGAAIGRRSDRRLVFTAELKDGNEHQFWRPVEGVQNVYYYDGLAGPHFRDMRTNENWEFVRVTWKYFGGEIDKRFDRCKFEGCNIYKINVYSWNRNSFFNCNFSGAKIGGNTTLNDLRGSGNFFESPFPPMRKLETDWSLVLIQRNTRGHAATSPAS